MKFVVSTLLLAFLVVATNAASLEKVESAEPKVVADKIEPEAVEPAAAIKAEPVQIVEAKSEEAVEHKSHSGEKIEPEAPGAVLKDAAPAEAEHSDKVCGSLQPVR